MKHLSRTEIQKILEASQGYDFINDMPSKKFFILEDDIHSGYGFSYLGKEADTFQGALDLISGSSDWAYQIHLTDGLALVAYGVIFDEAQY